MKKDTRDLLLTNLNIAAQGDATRKKIEETNSLLYQMQRQEALRVQQESEEKEEQKALKKIEAESKRLLSIETEGALALENEFKFIVFKDEASMEFIGIDDLTARFQDRLAAQPQGAGKYFEWLFIDEENFDEQANNLPEGTDVALGLYVMQKDAWLIAKGRDPKRVKRQRELKAFREEEEEREREKYLKQENQRREHEARERNISKFKKWAFFSVVCIGIEIFLCHGLDEGSFFALNLVLGPFVFISFLKFLRSLSKVL